MCIKKVIKHLVFQLINPTLSYNPREGIKSLQRKMFLYFFLHPGIKKKYSNEIVFTGKQSNDTYSFVFPYPFVFNCSYKDVCVYMDDNLNLYYVLHENKKLYFSRKYDTKEKVQIAYYCAVVEQDKESPHCYLTENFKIEDGDVVFDVGAAEGILGLDNIEKISKLYVFEADPKWILALEATFAPWKDKVVIVNKYVSDNDNENDISLDTFLFESKIDLLKIDVEGTEREIFRGSQKILMKTKKIAVCTYHKKDDDIHLNYFLIQHGFKTSFSTGYVLFVLRKLVPPYYCKCLIRATNNNL